MRRKLGRRRREKNDANLQMLSRASEHWNKPGEETVDRERNAIIAPPLLLNYSNQEELNKK
jgi:hypothetical protein